MDNWWTNWSRTHPKCPRPFQQASTGMCVMPCPYDKKFIRKGSSEGFKCVYWPDEQHEVPLVSIGATVFDGRTIIDLQQVDPDAAGPFLAEQQRSEEAMAVVYENIDKQQKLNDAFQDLQDAENARGESPSAYQAARTAYYTLLKGPSWIDEERQRISAAEVTPEVQKYRTAVEAVNVRTQEQQKTIDIVNGLKDKVLSLKDDFGYSVNTFSDQLEKVKIQLNMENRSREQERDTTWSWIDFILNALLVAVLLYAAYTLLRRFLRPKPLTTPVTTIRIPTYTGQPLYS